MRIIYLVITLLAMGCKHGVKPIGEQVTDTLKVDDVMADSIAEETRIRQMIVYEGEGHRIYLEKRDYQVYCYADSRRVIFNDDMLDDGAIGLYYHRPANSRYIYIIGATYYRYGGGWQDGLHLYRMDIHTLALKHIGNYAAIHFEDNGFKVANVERQLNPDAKSRGEERYAIRDYFFDNNGEFVKKGRNEYEDLYKEYGDSIMNAVGIGYLP